jgi:spermidine synthase
VFIRGSIFFRAARRGRIAVMERDNERGAMLASASRRGPARMRRREQGPARRRSPGSRASAPGDRPPLLSNEPAAWRWIAFACFFLSGAAGLIAEVCWIRRASLAFGSTVYAVSTVLAVFFLGLAAGSFVFGERSPRIARPLRAYALLELALAVLVVASLPLFDAADALYGRLYRAGGPGIGLQAARVGLVALVLLPPTLLMGGTLPLFVRHFATVPSRIGRTVGLLYGVNTLGAAAGAALCGFVLLPRLGMQRSLFLAAGLELLAGALVGAVGWRRSVPVVAATAQSMPRARGTGTPDRAAVTVVALLFFVTGFVAVGNEVLWTRFLALVVRTTVLTYTISLMVVLAGIVLGTSLIALVADRGLPRARLFGALLASTALTALGLTLLPPAVWRAADWWAYLLLLLPPAVFSGATFPLAVRMVVEEPALAGSGAGRMAAVNTVGAIAGSLLVGFAALPRFGLHATLLSTTGLALAAAFVAWWRLDSSRLPARLAVTVACALAWIALPRLLGTRLPQDHLAAPEQLVAHREGRESNLAVVRRQGVLHLEADRWWQGQDRPTHQVMAAHVPLLLHPAPRRVLVVGAGAGQTPAHVLLHDVERLDCIDIEPAVFDLVRAHFDAAWMEDPRTHLLLDDGRSYISHSAARYDLIAIEVGQLFRPGVANFYTVDFYRAARDRLAPGGILSQFVPLPFLSPDGFRRVLATFLEVLPQSVLWYNTAELLLLGVNAARFEVPAERLDLLTSDTRLHSALRYAYWGGPSYWLNQPHVFLGGFLVGPNGLAALAAGAGIESDDRPRLAYATLDATYLEANELAILDLLRPRLEPIESILSGTVAPETLAGAVQVRERNLGDMVASALLRRVDALVAAGQRAELIRLLDDARRANPENVQAHRLAGDLALLEGRQAEAEARYGGALELNPEDAASHLGLARLRQRQQRAAEAAEHYRVALAQRPGEPETHNAFGGALAQTGDVDGARRQFELALELRPNYAEAHNNLAAVLHRSGDAEAARRHLEAAVRLRPDYAEARANLERLRDARESSPAERRGSPPR